MSENDNLNIEEIKEKKDGLDVLSDLYIYAVLGEKASEEDLIRFQWYGIYQQEDDETNSFFQIRIPLQLGELNFEQLKVLKEIIQDFSKGYIKFTRTQKVIIEWIKIFDLPQILNKLFSVNLKTICSAGHTIRNVITCPLNGIDSAQIADVSDLANKLNEAFIGNKNFSNLPNKFKIAISGYKEGCDLDYTPDLSFNAYKDDKNKIIFSVKILNKHLGFINPSQVLITARAIAKLYKNFGNRESIKKTSFDALIEEWGYDKFFDILSTNIKFKKINLNFYEKDIPKTPRLGINKSKIENESYIGCKINKKIDIEDLNKFLFLMDKYNANKTKLTHKGNIIILDVKSTLANEFANELKEINFNAFN